ncbi:alanine racemase [Calidifontibacillus erzurumensis]|uniref:Alanine racemase n=1 Tax=Calidifontibacillus erzurumensis TaxID=2741433 RepID=A0A8J8GEL6_9BACI|nr:alanine racemase [Calidifontibacillus erzurumensis]NSL52470.1 alanine racemase [Calidifontibacillus erzurumensis]
METVFYRDTWAEVDLNCIYENVQNLKKHLPNDVAIIAVVKANGYGHGALQVARTALEAGASFLAVALLDEALELRKQGINAPILVLGWTRPKDVQVAIRNNITLTVFQMDWLKTAKEFLDEEQQVHFHLKIDTGMGRIGVREEEEFDEIINFLKEHPQFKMTGVFTHFATADELDTSYFQMQYNRFLTCISWLNDRNIEVEMIHCANSATALRFPDKVFNAVRFGISMYGLSPSTDIKDQLPFPLKEAFSLKSKIVHVKEVAPGERISYGGTYQTEKNEWIGTVPIGYADGWIRKLKFSEVLICGKRCPIIGRICMDQMMVALPKKVPVGTEVTLIGSQGSEKISIDEVAQRLDTINYEIPCLISSRVPRTYINLRLDGKHDR